MEMAMEVKDELGVQVERLEAAAGALESALERLREIDVTAVGAGFSSAVSSRERELEEKLAAAEATIATLRAGSAGSAGFQGGRKTLAAGVESLMAKSGVAAEITTSGALDAALVSLSIEQRIAVKAGMLRAGLVG